MKPKYYECGICSCFHPVEWNGDCREDEHRYAMDELDNLHGGNGWDQVDQPGTTNPNWFELRANGNIYPLGEHKDWFAADMASTDAIWVLDEETAKRWITQLGGVPQ